MSAGTFCCWRRAFRAWTATTAPCLRTTGALQGNSSPVTKVAGGGTRVAWACMRRLWESASRTAHSCAARLAVEHAVHEARGLDVLPNTIAKFK